MRRLRRYLRSPYAVRQFLIELATRDYRRLHPRVGRFVLRFGPWGYRIVTLWSRPLETVLVVLSKLQWRKLPFYLFMLWGWGLRGGVSSLSVLWIQILSYVLHHNFSYVYMRFSVKCDRRWPFYFALKQQLRGPILNASRLVLNERRRQLWKISNYVL